MIPSNCWVPTDENLARLHISAAANSASRGSSRGGAPSLTVLSSRLDLIGWLAWNDPNGVYRDEDCFAEGWEPMTLDEAWRQVEIAVEDYR